MSQQYKRSNNKSKKSQVNLEIKFKLDTLTELFPDWTNDDLIDLVNEFEDLETIIEKIATGAVTKWDKVKKPFKKDKQAKEQVMQNFSLSTDGAQINSDTSSGTIFSQSTQTLPSQFQQSKSNHSASNQYNSTKPFMRQNNRFASGQRQHKHQQQQHYKKTKVAKENMKLTVQPVKPAVASSTSWAAMLSKKEDHKVHFSEQLDTEEHSELLEQTTRSGLQLDKPSQDQSPNIPIALPQSQQHSCHYQQRNAKQEQEESEQKPKKMTWAAVASKSCKQTGSRKYNPLENVQSLKKSVNQVANEDFNTESADISDVEDTIVFQKTAQETASKKDSAKPYFAEEETTTRSVLNSNQQENSTKTGSTIVDSVVKEEQASVTPTSAAPLFLSTEANKQALQQVSFVPEEKHHASQSQQRTSCQQNFQQQAVHYQDQYLQQIPQQPQANQAQQYYMNQYQFSGYSCPGMFDSQSGYPVYNQQQFGAIPLQASQNTQQASSQSHQQQQQQQQQYGIPPGYNQPGELAARSPATSHVQPQQQPQYGGYGMPYYFYQQSFPYAQPQYGIAGQYPYQVPKAAYNYYQPQQAGQTAQQGHQSQSLQNDDSSSASATNAPQSQKNASNVQQSHTAQAQAQAAAQAQFQQYYQLQQHAAAGQQGMPYGHSGYDYTSQISRSFY